MSEGAKDSKERAESEILNRKKYYDGEISESEAYNLGIIDEQGVEIESFQQSWKDSGIGTQEELNDVLDSCLRRLGL